MPKYIGLTSWTDEGIKHVKDSPTRLDQARQLAKSEGATLEQFFMVTGEHDMVVVIDAPDDATLARFLLKLARGGAVRTRTMRAFTEEEYRAIVSAG